jgi:hypothetical protein
LFKHEDKAAIIWEAFKDIIGVSELSHIFFDLRDLIQLVANLEGLVAPFQHEEIDSIVKELKSSKSPGPDGFNSDFMKKCWPVIQEDFYDLCSTFFNHDLC